MEQIIAIQQVAAPTFDEARRAEHMAAQFRAVGAAEVETDVLHNVFARLPGSDANRSPLVVSAHLDTVFPATTDLATRRDGALVYGPGIGDNSTGLTPSAADGSDAAVYHLARGYSYVELGDCAAAAADFRAAHEDAAAPEVVRAAAVGVACGNSEGVVVSAGEPGSGSASWLSPAAPLAS